MSGFTTYGSLMESRSRGFRDDYSVNTLQLSNGVTKDGDVVFSEIAPSRRRRGHGLELECPLRRLRQRRLQGHLHQQRLSQGGQRSGLQDGDVRRAPAATSAIAQRALDILNKLPAYEESNYVFRNAGDLTFTDKSKAWGMDQPSFSYGAAYADLE